jgi:hypothetical protein
MIRDFLAGWSNFWFRQVPPHAQALFRIAFGLFLLISWGLQWPTVILRYSTDSVVVPFVMDQEIFFVLPEVALFTFACFYVCLFLLTIGLAMRPAAFIAFCCYLYYWLLSLYLVDAPTDLFFMMILFLLTFSGCDRAFSVSMRRRRDSWWAWQETSVLPQRIIAVQLSAIYVSIGLQKFFLPSWKDGHILYQSFVGRWATSISRTVAAMDLPPILYTVAAKGIGALEILLPIGLSWRKTRWILMAVGCLFHLIIAISLGMWWHLALPLMYILFIPPEDVYLFLKKRSNGKIL